MVAHDLNAERIIKYIVAKPTYAGPLRPPPREILFSVANRATAKHRKHNDTPLAELVAYPPGDFLSVTGIEMFKMAMVLFFITASKQVNNDAATTEQ